MKKEPELKVSRTTAPEVAASVQLMQAGFRPMGRWFLTVQSPKSRGLRRQLIRYPR
jgi:hypothetical protein